MTRPLHVLLVEDYGDARLMYAQYLRARGYRVSEAADGLAAVRQASRVHPDVIVMDLSLPRLGGAAAAARIRRRAGAGDVPIIAVTGSAVPAEMERALAAGCACCLVKPCRPDALASAIERVVSPQPVRRAS